MLKKSILVISSVLTTISIFSKYKVFKHSIINTYSLGQIPCWGSPGPYLTIFMKKEKIKVIRTQKLNIFLVPYL